MTNKTTNTRQQESKAMSHEPIKTAMERFRAYCASKGIPEKSSLAHIHKMSEFEEHERKELRAQNEAQRDEIEKLKQENIKIENERDQLKQDLHDLQERFNGIKFIESELRKDNASLNTQVSGLKNELIVSLKDWHELNTSEENLKQENEKQANRIKELETPRDPYEKLDIQGKIYIAGLHNQIETLKQELDYQKEVNESLHNSSNFTYESQKRDIEAQAKRIAELEAATEHLGLTPQQASDGLARYKAQVAEIQALRKQVEELEAIKPKRHALTAQELSDPEYMESYLEAMHDDIDECVKYQSELRSEIEAHRNEVEKLRKQVEEIKELCTHDYETKGDFIKRVKAALSAHEHSEKPSTKED